MRAHFLNVRKLLIVTQQLGLVIESILVMNANRRDRVSRYQMNNQREYNFQGYLFFWFGQLASLAGTNIVNFSLTWWITIQTGSAFLLGLSAFFAFGSFILITPVAGVLVDRWSRKKVIVIADSLLALLSLILVVLFALGIANIIHVLIIQLIGGMLGAFHQMAVQAIIPIMVPQKHLGRMNSMQYFATSLIQTVGPTIGALVFTFLIGNMARILLIDIGTYTIAIIPTLLVFIPAVRIKLPEEKSSFRQEFSEGLTFMKQHRGLLTLLTVFAITNFLLPPIFLLLPLYSTFHLAFGDLNLAVLFLASLMSLQSLSMMIASAVISVWGGFKRNIIGVFIGIFSGALAMVVLALTPPGSFWVAAIGIALLGLTVPIANISSQTIWQKVVPPEKIGRVFSVRTTIAQFTGPFAFLVGGILGELFAIPLIFLLFGTTLIIVLILAWLLSSLPRIEEQLENNNQTKNDENEATQIVPEKAENLDISTEK
jgi:DHA3 family macrolide efflux protein-like MFS transporter